MREFLQHCLVRSYIPLIIIYQFLTTDPFLVVTCEKATRLEQVADFLFIPYHYAFMGRKAIQKEDGSWHFESRFDYADHFWIKNIPSFILAPVSFVWGGTLKALAYCFPEVRSRYQSLRYPPVHLHTDLYKEADLFQKSPIGNDFFHSQGLPRRPGDENHMAQEKEALREIGNALTKAGILWWVDCGTCLGAYRYGGAIPWDIDVDIAILEPDFQNVYCIVKNLNPKKYLVFDMSAREHPMTLLKVLLKNEPWKEIDIYHFRIDSQKRTLNFILSQENNIFMFNSWKIRERPFKSPAKFEDVFPLKRALFDGIEVFVPNNIIGYLSRVYGENLAPAKIYNPKTRQYEKDLSHPYWQHPFAH